MAKRIIHPVCVIDSHFTITFLRHVFPDDADIRKQAGGDTTTGHSYGGMVITGVAAKMPDRIRRLVYLDAALPDPGESLYDILRLGLSRATGSQPVLPETDPPYVEKLQFDAGNIKPLKKTYILCTKSEFKDVTRSAREKIAADRKGWTYIELPSSHVPMADMPDEFYQLMLDAAKK